MDKEISKMNKKKYIWSFLEDLRKNNSKEWMDEHRNRYLMAKGYWLEEIAEILGRLAKHDLSFELFTPKSTISRINNNRMFHPDKPIYKGSFSFAPIGKTDQVMKAYFSFGPELTVIGGGLYRPQKEELQSLRQAIDYDASELIEIIESHKFKKIFGGLADDPTELKTSPRGYKKDHPQIDLLRRKSFTGSYVPSKEMLFERNLADMIEEAYLTLLPLNHWLQKAISI